jgi:hypothetical protein
VQSTLNICRILITTIALKVQSTVISDILQLF